MALVTTNNPNRTGTRTAAVVAGSRSIEAEYRASIVALSRTLKEQGRAIGALVNAGESADTIRIRIEQEVNFANRRFEAAAGGIAQDFIANASVENKEKIQRMLRGALGVSTAQIIDSDQINERLSLALLENVNLIKSIPDRYYNNLTRAIIDNYQGKLQPGTKSLAGYIQTLGQQTDRKAKFIARDQTANLIGNLNQIRQKDAGIEEYIWRTVRDERVVGKPGGRYPKGNRQHGNHYDREGKTFRWDDPPHDGHPGQAIGCRCRAAPKINLNSVNKSAINL